MTDRALLVVLLGSLSYLAARLFGFLAGVGGVQRHHVETATYIFAVVAACTAFVRTERRADNGRTRASLHQPRALPYATSRNEGSAGAWWPTLAVFGAASLLLYGGSLGLGFFSDDFVLAERAVEGRWFGGWEFVRPLPTIVWKTVLPTPGGAWALHVLNVVLHGVNATLVSRLCGRIGFSRAEALAAGVLFLVFPSSVEAVVWPAASSDLIVASAALGFLLLVGRPASGANTAAVLALLVAALLSKESAVVIPALGLIMWSSLPDIRRTPGLRTLLIAFFVSLAYAAARATFGPISGGYLQRPTRYMLKEILAQPIATLTLPWSQSVLAPYWWMGLAGALVMIAAVAHYSWSPRKLSQPAWVVRCLVAALVCVLPVYSLLFINPNLENARYVYLPTAFWVMGLTSLTRVESGVVARVVRTSAVIAAVSAGAIGVQWHLGPWKEAALLRDAVLGAARTAASSSRCATVTFSSAPDNVRGAYVFRNGLNEALAFRSRPGLEPDGKACRFVWDGKGFRPDPPER